MPKDTVDAGTGIPAVVTPPVAKVNPLQAKLVPPQATPVAPPTPPPPAAPLQPYEVTANRMKDIVTQFPELFPGRTEAQLNAADLKLLATIAQQPTDDRGLAKTLSQVLDMAKINANITALKAMAPNDQRTAWSGMGTYRKVLLTQAGYSAPPEQHNGLFDFKLPILHTQIAPSTIWGKTIAAGVAIPTKVIRAVGGVALDGMTGAGQTLPNRLANSVITGTGMSVRSEAENTAKVEAKALESQTAIAQMRQYVAQGKLTQSKMDALLKNRSDTLVHGSVADVNGLPIKANNQYTTATVFPDAIEWLRKEGDQINPKGMATYAAYSTQKRGGLYETSGLKGMMGAWEASAHPEREFRPEAEIRARNLLNDDEGMIYLAKRFAAEGTGSKEDPYGKGIAAVLADDAALVPGSPQYMEQAQALHTLIGNTDEFDNAVNVLATHKVGFGSTLARAAVTSGAMHENEGWARKVNTGGTVWFMFKGDMFNGAMKALHGVHLARYATNVTRGESVIDELRLTKGVADGTVSTAALPTLARIDLEQKVAARVRVAEKVVEMFSPTRTRSSAEIFADAPVLEKQFGFLRDYHNTNPIRTVGDVFDAWSSSAGSFLLASAASKVPGGERAVEIPALTKSQFAFRKAAVWSRESLSYLSDLEPKGTLGLVPKLVVRAPARVIESTFMMQPAAGYMDATDLTTFRRALHIGMFGGISAERRASYLDQFTRAVTQVGPNGESIMNEGIAKGIVTRFYEELFDNVGINATGGSEAGRALYNRIIHGVYTVGADDKYIDPITRTIGKAGLLPSSDYSGMMAIPNISEIYRAADKGLWLKSTYGFANPRWLETFMSRAWKPAMLIRASFVTRNSGEELLNFVLRHGPGEMYDAYAAKGLAKKELAGHTMELRRELTKLTAAGDMVGAAQVRVLLGRAEDARVLSWMRPFTGSIEWLTGVSSGAARSRYLGPMDKFAHWIADTPSALFRTFAGRGLTPDQYYAARQLVGSERTFQGARVLLQEPLFQDVQAQLVVGHSLADHAETAEAAAQQMVGVKIGSRDVQAVGRRWLKSDQHVGATVGGDETGRMAYAIGAQKLRDDVLWPGIQTPLEGAITPNVETSIANAVRPAGKTKTRFATVRGVGIGTRPATVPESVEAMRRTLRQTTNVADHLAEEAISKLAATGTTATMAHADRNLESVFEDSMNAYLEHPLQGLSTDQLAASIVNRGMGADVQTVRQLSRNTWANAAGQHMLQDKLRSLDVLQTQVAPLDPALAKKIGSAKRELKALTEVRLGARERQLVLGRGSVRLTTENQIRGFAKETMLTQLESKEAAPWVATNIHAQSAGGIPVARPASEHLLGMYMPTFTDNTMTELDTLFTSGALAPAVAALPQRDQELLRAYLDNITPTSSAGIGTAGGVHSHWSTFAVPDHRAADRVGDIVTRLTKTETDGYTIHLTDVPNPAGSRNVVRRATTNPKPYLPPDVFGAAVGKVGRTEVYSLPDRVLADTIPMTGAHVDLGDGIVRPGVPRTAAMNEFADKTVNHFLSILMPKDGEVAHELLQPLIRNEGNMLMHIQNMTAEALPASVVIPRLFVDLDEQSFTRKLVSNGYEFLQQGVDGLSRDPMLIAEFSKAREVTTAVADSWLAGSKAQLEVAAFNAQFMPSGLDMEDVRYAWSHIPEAGNHTSPQTLANMVEDLTATPTSPGVVLNPDHARVLRNGLAEEQHVRTLAEHTALDRSVDAIIPYIDDHRERSYAAEAVKGAFPFAYAEQAFLKRWMTTALRSPEAIHRAQLYLGAGRRIGIITKDANGNDVLNYPMTGALHRLLSDTPVISDVLFGGQAGFPFLQAITGQVNKMIPGASSPGQVSANPIFQIGIGLTHIFHPEAQALEDSMYGNHQSTAFWEKFVPAGVRKMLKGTVVQDPAYIDRVTIQTIAALSVQHDKVAALAQAAEDAGQTKAAKRLWDQAAGLGPHGNPVPGKPGHFEEPSTGQKQQYIEEVRRYSRGTITMHGIIQLSAPTGGKITDPEGLQDEMFAEIAKAGSWPEGVHNFLTKHPYAEAYTVFGSESTSGKPADYTQEALDWMHQNKQVVKDHKNAGAWLVPDIVHDDKFVRQAMTEQQRAGWRRALSPAEFLDKIDIVKAGNVYYPEKEKMDALVKQYSDANGGNAAQRRQIKANFHNQFENVFLAQHPAFKAHISVSAGVPKRIEVRADMMKYAKDPNRKPDVHSEVLIQMTERFDHLQAELKKLDDMNGVPGKTKTAVRAALKSELQEWGVQVVNGIPSKGVPPVDASAKGYWDSIIAIDANFDDVADGTGN